MIISQVAKPSLQSGQRLIRIRLLLMESQFQILLVQGFYLQIRGARRAIFAKFMERSLFLQVRLMILSDGIPPPLQAGPEADTGVEVAAMIMGQVLASKSYLRLFRLLKLCLVTTAAALQPISSKIITQQPVKAVRYRGLHLKSRSTKAELAEQRLRNGQELELSRQTT